MKGLALVFLASLAVLAPVRAGAAPQAKGPDRAFVDQLVAAINSKDWRKRIALVHRGSLACVHADADSIYREMFARQARRHVPAGFHWTIAARKKEEPPLFADLFEYPVRPTHLLQLDFEPGPTSSTTLLVQLARDGNRWREVVGCPKQGTVAAIRSARQARRKETERAQALAAGIAPQLRDSVLQLFREGRRIEAYQKYASASGEDLATAKQVVDLLADRARLPR